LEIIVFKNVLEDIPYAVLNALFLQLVKIPENAYCDIGKQ